VLAHSLALVGLETRLINLDTTSRPIVIGSSSTPSRLPQRGTDTGARPAESPPPVQILNSVDQPSSSPLVPPAQVQINGELLVAAASRQQLLADIDATSKTLEARQGDYRQAFESGLAELERQLGQRDGGFLSTERVATDQPAGTLVAQLDSEIQALQAEAQDQRFQLEVLTQSLEQAKSARTTLEVKLQEASIASASSGKAVVASRATSPPGRSYPPPLSRSLPVAAIVGALIGAAGALLSAWPRPPPRAPRGGTDSSIGANGVGEDQAREGSTVVASG
jgi:hypothetical protein